MVSMEEKDKEMVDCKHYRRKASLVAPCCNTVYPCRFCHNEAEDHELVRGDVTHIACRSCGARQPVAARCNNCHIQFAQYFCAICRLYDDEPKRQFHCVGCGFCRSGGDTESFHCDTCDICLPLFQKDNHKCIQRVGRSDCPVCMESVHSAPGSTRILKCGHLIHQVCFEGLIKHGISTCPNCSRSLFDRSREWGILDGEILVTKLPSEMRHCFVKVLCRDCQQRGETPFHLLGLKCTACGSYNTCREAGPLLRRAPSPDGMERFRKHIDRLLNTLHSFNGALSRGTPPPESHSPRRAPAVAIQ